MILSTKQRRLGPDSNVLRNAPLNLHFSWTGSGSQSALESKEKLVFMLLPNVCMRKFFEIRSFQSLCRRFFGGNAIGGSKLFHTKWREAYWNGSKLNLLFSSLCRFCHVPLPRVQLVRDWRFWLNHTPNAFIAADPLSWFLCIVFLSWVDSIKPTFRHVLAGSKKLAWIAAIYHCKLIRRTRWWTLSIRVCVCACVSVYMHGCLSPYVDSAKSLVDIEYTCVCVCLCVCVCVSMCGCLSL